MPSGSWPSGSWNEVMPSGSWNEVMPSGSWNEVMPSGSWNEVMAAIAAKKKTDIMNALSRVSLSQRCEFDNISGEFQASGHFF